MISFLLGSGFSFTDGVPLVSDINRQILELTLDDIYIDTDMSIRRIKKEDQPEYKMRWADEKFFVEFLKHYSQKIIDNPEHFNYETFFDYLTEYSQSNEHNEEIHEFCEYFRNTIIKDAEDKKDDRNLIHYFIIYFNQILSSFIDKSEYYRDVTFLNYPQYDSFINFIKELLKKHDVRIHSLNHDLLFEHIASKNNDLAKHFTDGFEELNSPYYGEVRIETPINKTYRVRLKRFIDNFDKALALYKLHGSIDMFIADFSVPLEDQVRIKKDFGVSAVYKEVFDQNLDSFNYSYLMQNDFPDFLSGTTTKISQYNIPYYEKILNHFKNNLKNSSILFVIGYGFKDEGINRILRENYSASKKELVVIDKKIPDCRIITDYSVEAIEKSFNKISFKDYMDKYQKL